MRPVHLAAACAAFLAACHSDPSPTPPVTPASQAAPPETAAAQIAPIPLSTGAARALGAPVDDVKLAQPHPRIWITAADLPRLRSWATPSNPVYRDGILKALAAAVANYDKEFFPGGQPNPKWPDTGIDNWVGRCTEAYAEFFAFMSQIDPDPQKRADYGQRAKNLLMYAIHEAEKGVDPDRQHPAPFRGPAFAVYNRANAWGETFGVTVDWIYPLLSADDKAAIRRVFMRWANENIHATTTAQEHPEPIGVRNDPRIIADRHHLRWAANNYFTGHMRQLTMYGLSLDPADDPPLDSKKPVEELGNSLRSYLENAMGAWLYMQFAVYEDPKTAAAALGVPENGLGVASGGLSPEGFLYGLSMGPLYESLLALHTAGYRDIRKHGPQISLIESPFWDRYMEGFLQSMVPESATVPGQEYLGPVFQMANYGDTLRFWLTPEHAAAFLSLAIHDMHTGNTKRAEKARWIAMNALEGGAQNFNRRISNIWGNSNATLSILHFLAFDPAAPAPTDPRPSLPTVFVDRAQTRILARTEQSPNTVLFDYKCTWSTIGHQHGDCNQFELFRKGEWLIKERSGYANDPFGITSANHNTLAIQNKVTSGAAKPRSLQWFEGPTWDNGGQFVLGQNAGDPKTLTSIGPGWVYAMGDATPLYNRPGREPDSEAVDVSHASRSIVWIQPDDVVIYDRATTRSDGRFKRFYLVTVGKPEVNGKLSTVTTPKGQKLFVQTLLPTAAKMTAGDAGPYNALAEGEPSRYRITVEDPANPRDLRLLHALHAADASGANTTMTAVQSSAGTPFTGAVVGNVTTMFPVDLATAFTKVTYAVPASVTAQIVTGLAPGASYDVSTKRAGGNVEVTITPGSAYKADEGGVIAVGALGGKRP